MTSETSTLLTLLGTVLVPIIPSTPAAISFSYASPTKMGCEQIAKIFFAPAFLSISVTGPD